MVGGGAHLNQVVPLLQLARQHLLIAQNLAVAQSCGQVPVGCRGDPPALRPEPCRELFAIPSSQSFCHQPIHGQAMGAELKR